MCDNDRRFIRVNVVRDSVNSGTGFFNIGAKNVIEYHEYATKIFVKIFWISTVMHPVIRRRIKEVVKPAQLTNLFRVNEVIVDGRHRFYEYDHRRGKSNKAKRRPKQKAVEEMKKIGA